MPKLIIEIPLDGNDLEQTDLDVFYAEAAEASGINVEVGRSLSEEESHIVRSFNLAAECFTVRVEE